MAVKTITIDVEAYEALAAQKKPGESFSQVIKRRLAPPRTAAALLARLKRLRLAEETLDRMDEIVRHRRDSLANSPPVD